MTFLIGLAIAAAGVAILELILFATLPPLQAIFLQISGLGIAAAVGTVTARNLVHAALYLVAFFFLVACQFVLLEAEFMAAMQVLVYIGAVAILLMFGIMLTRNIQGDETTGGAWTQKIPAAIVAAALLGLLIYGIRDEKGIPSGEGARSAWSATARRPVLDEPGRVPSAAVNDMARTIGEEMMTRWVIPFEVAGLLLTAALVGAIALAMSDKADEESPRLGAMATVRPGTTLDPTSAVPASPGLGASKREAFQSTAPASEPR